MSTVTEARPRPTETPGEVHPTALVLPRWLKIALPLVIVVVLVFHAVYIMLWPWGMFYQIDMRVYRAAGMAVLHNQSLYDHGLVGKLAWVYTPLGAVPFIPMAALTVQQSRIVWDVVNLAALVFCVARCWWFLGYGRRRSVLAVAALTTVLATALEPLRTTIFLGQINIVLMALVLWDLLRRPGKQHSSSRWAGVGIGIAAGIKLTPLLFIPYLLLTRRFRAAGVAAATFVGTIGLGFVLTPHSAWAYWMERKFADTSRISALDSPVNQSIRGWLARMWSVSETQTLWAVVALAATVLGLRAAALAWRHGQELLGLSIVGMCSTAVSPFSWDHHWVWFVPLSVYFVHRALTARQPVYWVMTAFVYIAGLAWPTRTHAPHNTTNSPTTGINSLDWPGDGITRNIYVITFVVVTIFTLRHFRIRPTSVVPPTRELAGV